MSEGRLNGWGKMAITAVITFLGTSGLWNLAYADRPTRDQVQEMIDRDNRALVQAVNDLKAEQRELKAKIDRLIERSR